MRLALFANTANQARALHQPFYIKKKLPVISLTTDLASKAGGRRGIIGKHKYDEAPHPCDPELQPLNTRTAKTKKAPDC
ncbi:hypothetical protein [Pseudomonas prosekii]|uniref:hypothetical protein n=1 Tax=Pseudomonas prosekii TaxID=1148509 RepID=UPI003F74E3C1